MGPELCGSAPSLWPTWALNDVKSCPASAMTSPPISVSKALVCISFQVRKSVGHVNAVENLAIPLAQVD